MILADMRGFIVIIGMIIVGFSLIFLEFGRSTGDDDDYANYLLNTYGLLYGNYSTDNLPAVSNADSGADSVPVVSGAAEHVDCHHGRLV